MGYTHYWRIPVQALPLVGERLPAIVGDFRKLLPHLPPLAGPLGKGGPEFGPEEVAFNGPEPEDYEAFVFPGLLRGGEPFVSEDFPEEHFAFCKTGYRPYDLAVTAFLLVAKFHLGDLLQVRSDGDVSEWTPAADLVERVLRLPVDLMGVLGVGLVLVEDGEGRRFLLEEGLDPLPEGEGTVKHLEQLERFLPWWPFRGPYRILGEAKASREELGERIFSGVYLLPASQAG